MQGQMMTWQNAIMSALGRIWNDFIMVIPSVLGAVIVLVVGLCLAGLLARLCRQVVDFTKLDTFLHKTVGLGKLKERGMDVNAAGLVSWVVKWFFIIVTFIAVADILKWAQLTNFFEQVASYIPNVIVAVLFLLAGFIVGGGLKDLVIKSVKASTLPSASAGVLGTVARWAVIVFAFMAALTQLQIAADLVKILFTGFVGMLAVAGGLAFGLGGRDHASQWLEKIRREMKH